MKLPERKKDGQFIYDSKRILREDAGQHLNSLQDDKSRTDSGSEIWTVLENCKERF